MRKRIAAILLAGFMLTGVLSPLPVSAAGGIDGQTVQEFPSVLAAGQKSSPDQAEDQLLLETKGNVITVKLVMPFAADEKLSSLQLKLKINDGDFSEFVFDSQMMEHAKLAQAYYNSDNKTMDIYIAGTQPLYVQGSDTLVIGSVTVKKGVSDTARVEAGDVKVVRGTILEGRNLSESVQISYEASGTPGNGSYDPGITYPSQPSEPSQPSQPSEPSEPSQENGANPDDKEDEQPKPGQDTPEPEKPQQPAEEKAVGKPHLQKVKNVTAGITIKWSKSSNASGYYVYRRALGKRWTRIAKVNGKTTTSYTDKAVKSKNGKTYFYTVKAYKGKKLSAYDKQGMKIYRLDAPKSCKLISKPASTITVKWKENQKADGFQVQLARSSDLKKQKVSKNMKSASKVSESFTNLKQEKTYYVRVRCYKKLDGVVYYSTWSKVEKIKTLK